MNLPAFFDQVPAIELHDPLAQLLGAAAGGLLEYRYADAVKLAGHSCPTVAGAWLMARHGLAALYPDGVPERGGVRVEFAAPLDAGTTGVVGAVLGLVTGAAGEGGFKGLGRRHSRRGLLAFGIESAAGPRLTRLDNGAAVRIEYHPERVPADPDMAPLMARVVGGVAGPDDLAAFARLWQERVRRILIDHGDDRELVVVRGTSEG